MRVELLHFDDCPSYEALLRRLQSLLAEAGVADEVELRRVETSEAAMAERFLGSPTLRVGGVDVEPGASEREDFGLKCRLFFTPAGLTGMPDEEWIRAAVGHANGEPADQTRPAPSITLDARDDSAPRGAGCC